MLGKLSALAPQKFRISVDQPEKVYRPGDPVTGKVILNSPDDEEVVNISVILCTFMFSTGLMSISHLSTPVQVAGVRRNSACVRAGT